jgi:peptidoglycan/LPS O-acetylase OafA/YrhL
MLFHFFPSYLPGGFVGVDIFFVISGYLITGVITSELDHGVFSLRTFYARRIKRLLPALCLVLATVAAFGWIFLLANEYTSLGKQIVAAGGFSSNILLMLETSYFKPTNDSMPLLHLWSLGVEEQFYIVWPLILVLCVRFWWGILSTALCLGLISLIVNLYSTPTDGVQAFYSPITRAWELMIGAVVAIVHRSRVTHPSEQAAPFISISGVLFVVGLLLITTGLITIHSIDPYPGWRALLPTCGAALIIAIRSPCRLHQILLSNPLMIKTGLISYPLYLWHWPLLSYATTLSAGKPSFDNTCAIIAATVVLSVATYHCCERPIRQGSPRQWKVVVPLLTLVAIAAFGGAVYLFNGFPSRTAAIPIYLGVTQVSYRDSCAGLTHNPAYEDDWCNPNLPTTQPSVLLLGDSLSAPYSAMLLELTKRQPFSFRQFARGQCTPFFGYGPKPCRELLDNVMSQDFIKDVKTIMIALDWRSYVYGKHYITFKHAPDETAEAFATALQATLNHWESLGKRVVILYSPPQGMNLDACISRRLSRADSVACRYTRKQAEERDANYRAKLREIVGERPNVLYFDPFPYMCSDSACMVTRGNEQMYVDSIGSKTEPPFFWNHMSDDGARYLANVAHEELLRLVELQTR